MDIHSVRDMISFLYSFNRVTGGSAFERLTTWDHRGCKCTRVDFHSVINIVVPYLEVSETRQKKTIHWIRTYFPWAQGVNRKSGVGSHGHANSTYCSIVHIVVSLRAVHSYQRGNAAVQLITLCDALLRFYNTVLETAYMYTEWIFSVQGGKSRGRNSHLVSSISQRKQSEVRV